MPSSRPVPGLAAGGGPWSPRGGEERPERRGKMKTHKISVSELEMEALARCAVPRKARQPEIDVLLPNERARNGNSRCAPSSDLWRCSFQHDSRGGVIPVPQPVFPTPFPGTEVWQQREELGRWLSGRRGRAEAPLPARRGEVHPGIKQGKVCLDAELLSRDAAGFLRGSASEA